MPGGNLSYYPLVHIVQLGDVWSRLTDAVWRLDQLGDYRHAARHIDAVTTTGKRVEIGCLSRHGLERKVLNVLIQEELRRRGWLAVDTEEPLADGLGGPYQSSPVRDLYLVPVVPIPSDVNTSVRSLLVANLQATMVRSVRLHPPAPGRSPNHFIVVPRVCSCFISADRKPALGRRARDDCQPFPRTSRVATGGKIVLSSDLSHHMRVLSYEQVTLHDRRWAASIPLRLQNVVVPYPSSFTGEDMSKGRPAPWQVELQKPVRIFAAFGMLLQNRSMVRRIYSELAAEVDTSCSQAELAAMRLSSCAGKRCRFALRALLMHQLDAARVPTRDRHR